MLTEHGDRYFRTKKKSVNLLKKERGTKKITSKLEKFCPFNNAILETRSRDVIEIGGKQG